VLYDGEIVKDEDGLGNHIQSSEWLIFSKER